MDSMHGLVQDVMNLLEKRDNAAITIYKQRGEDAASVSFSASVEELIDMAATSTIVAISEMEINLKIGRHEATQLVRDALDERLRSFTSGSDGSVRKMKG